jgi:hypothetical protein
MAPPARVEKVEKARFNQFGARVDRPVRAR